MTYSGVAEMEEAAIERIVRRTVRETLISMGVNINSATELQAMQADFAYLRRSRKGADDVVIWIKRSAIGIFCSGLLYALWEGFKAALKVKGGGVGG